MNDKSMSPGRIDPLVGPVYDYPTRSQLSDVGCMTGLTLITWATSVGREKRLKRQGENVTWL